MLTLGNLDWISAESPAFPMLFVQGQEGPYTNTHAHTSALTPKQTSAAHFYYSK